jgi:tetratricopeptide (TPR) repeat protein
VLGQSEAAEAALKEAIESRPDDPALWLTRSMALARLGRTDRAAADFAEALKRPPTDPRLWIEYGRFLAERGERARAEEMFAKAAALRPNDYNPFLDAGWWMVGPYPTNLAIANPPERTPDPSQPVLTATTKDEYRWRLAPVLPDGLVDVAATISSGALVDVTPTAYSAYALTYVYAPTEVTTVLNVDTANRPRVWLNGRLVYPLVSTPTGAVRRPVAIALRSGQNALLVRLTVPSKQPHQIVATFGDPAALAQLDPATAAFDQAVASAPDDADARLARGYRLAELGRWPEADADFAKAVELKPTVMAVWKCRARLYAELKQWDKAAADYDKALELAPPPPARTNAKFSIPFPWAVGRSGIEDELAQWDEVFDRVARLRPTDFALWVRRCHHFAQQGKWQDASAAMGQAVELNPDYDRSWYLRATLLLQIGDHEGYRAACRAALDHFQGTTDRLFAEVIASMCVLAPDGISNLQPVARLVDFALDDGEDIVSLWQRFDWGLVHLRTGEYGQAAERLATVASVAGPLGAKLAGVRAITFAKLGRHDDARQALAQAKAIVARDRPDAARGQRFTDWWDWLHADFFIREVEALLGPAGDSSGP